ncbi:MAG: magnetic particle specific iron-binding protein [Magnetococcales bacterium]|nr:magnetic particle specific iron-binding protein [Magnetococcales bacterium]
MPMTNMTVDLLAGESVKVVGPGTMEFHAPELANVAKGGGAAAGKGKAALAGGGKMAVAAGQGQGATVGGGKLIAAAGSTGTGAAGSAGTIWTGKGLSLGLGLGLGAWGPVIVAGAALGGYVYWRKKQAAKVWPF